MSSKKKVNGKRKINKLKCKRMQQNNNKKKWYHRMHGSFWASFWQTSEFNHSYTAEFNQSCSIYWISYAMLAGKGTSYMALLYAIRIKPRSIKMMITSPKGVPRHLKDIHMHLKNCLQIASQLRGFVPKKLQGMLEWKWSRYYLRTINSNF